jgi:predicted ATPase
MEILWISGSGWKMITRIEASGYRCLRSVAQELEPFQILVGPNGSGKSAFLDVLAFLGTAISKGLEAAVKERTEYFSDLVWGRENSSFELAIEAKIPEDLRVPVQGHSSETIRYEVEVRLDPSTETLVFEKENVGIRAAGSDRQSGFKTVSRARTQVHFQCETIPQATDFSTHPNHSALPSLPDLPEESKFPATAWLKDLLYTRIRYVKLDVNRLRKPSPPLRGTLKRLTGSHLARVVAQLAEGDSENFRAWLAHLRTCLPDLDSIRTVQRPEDKHRYLMIRQTNGVEVPSWALSEGTLRLLALTLLAYVPDFQGIYLIEEPENGVHPTAIETIYQSLSSIYEGQVMVASHSPILLSLAKPQELLCFTKTAQGTEIVRGSEHPALRDWRGEVNLSDLFAAGVLG